VTKEQTSPSGSILPSPTRLTPFTEEVSSYFEEIADNFSNRLEGYSVQYQELSVDAETSKDGQCPKLSDNVTCANTLYAKNECWSIGQPDTDCENQALCCFNGCENVCFQGIKVIDASEVTNEVIQNSSSNSCPPVVSQPYCQTSRPNCWSAGTYDLDCPNSGLCCFDGCHNRCLEIEEGKKQINERPTVPLYPTSEPKLPISENANDDDLPISTQREPILVLHIYTPQQNEAKVQTNRVSENSAINNRVYQNEQVVDEGHLQCPFLGYKPRNQCLHSQSECRRANTKDPNCGNGGLCCFDGCTYKCMTSEAGSLNQPNTDEETTVAATITRREGIDLCPRDNIVSRSHCRLQLQHECVFSSDCPGLGGRCCFNGCVNTCVNPFDGVPSFFYRRKK